MGKLEAPHSVYGVPTCNLLAALRIDYPWAVRGMPSKVLTP